MIMIIVCVIKYQFTENPLTQKPLSPLPISDLSNMAKKHTFRLKVLGVEFSLSPRSTWYLFNCKRVTPDW